MRIKKPSAKSFKMGIAVPDLILLNGLDHSKKPDKRLMRAASDALDTYEVLLTPKKPF